MSRSRPAARSGRSPRRPGSPGTTGGTDRAGGPGHRSALWPGQRSALWLAGVVLVGIVAVNPWGDQATLPLRWLVLAVGALGVAGAMAVRPAEVDRTWTLAWGALLGVTLAAALVGSDPRVSLLGDPQRRLGVLTWCLLGVLALGASSIVTSVESARPLFRGLSLLGLIEGILGVAETLGWSPFNFALSSSRAVGSVGNSAFLASVAVMCALASRVVAQEPGPWRAWGLAGLAGSVAAVVVSGTRSALAVLLLAVALSWVLGRRGWATGRREPIGSGEGAPSGGSRWAVPMAGGVGLLLGGAVGFGDLASRFGRSRGAFSTGLGRLDTWGLALRLGGRRALLGFGPEQMVVYFPRVITPEYERAYARARIPDRAHNLLIDQFVTTGVLGVIALLAVFGIAVRIVLSSRSRWRGTEREGWILGSLIAAGAGVVVEMALFPTVEADPMMWVLVGAAVGLARAAGPAASAGGKRSETSASPGGEDRTARVVGVIGVIIAIAAVVAATRGLVADRYSRLARDEAVLYPVRADQHLREAADLVPEASPYQLAAASLARTSNRRDLFDSIVQRVREEAAAHPQNPYLRGALARTLLTGAERYGDCDAAQEALDTVEAALPTDPNSGELHLFLGSAHFQLGEFDAARRAWERSDELLGRFGAARKNLDTLEERLSDPRSVGVVPCRAAGARGGPTG